MAGEFAETTLGCLLSFANGRSSPERGDGLPHPVYGSNGVIGFAADSNSDAGSIIIGRVGSYCGSLYLSKQRCWVTDNAIRATALGDNDSRFLFYLLGTLNLNDWRAGSGQPLLNQDILGRISAGVPDPDEQRIIAHILGTLDDKIELNRRMSETLEAMARALFKSWFVDFDPVRAKAEGRDPGLPQHIADLFPARLVDSELGEIPEGWGVNCIDNLAEIVGGSTPKTDRVEYWEEGTHRWVTPKDLSRLSMPVLLDTERRITDTGLAQISSGLLPAGTVLLSSRAPIGYLAIAEVAVAVNQGFIAMKPRAGTSNLFLLRWASASHNEIVRHANGSTFLEISKSNFRSIRAITPTSGVMREFDRLSRPMYRKVIEHMRDSHALAAMRDALLPKLLSGELTVRQTSSN
jgi:type I restriction enzyme S subunit